MQPNVVVADSDADSVIDKLKADVQSGDLQDFPKLLKLLRATHRTADLAAQLRSIALEDRFARFNAVQLFAILNIAERWAADAAIFDALLARINTHGISRDDLTAAEVRQRFRRSWGTSPLSRTSLVPIGAYCLAWTLPNRWGLRDLDGMTRAYTPLALAAHKLNFLLDQIEQDFANYDDPTKLKVIASTSGFQMVARRDGGVLWNHHIGEYWIENDFARFKEDLRSGLNKVRGLIGSDEPFGPVYVLHLATSGSDEKATALVERAHQALSKHRPGKDTYLICVDTGPHNERSHRVVDHGPTVARIVAGYPVDNYQWSVEEHFNSPAGIVYEQGVVDGIRDALMRWRGL